VEDQERAFFIYKVSAVGIIKKRHFLAMGWVRPRGTVARVSSTHTPHEMPTTIGDGDEGHGPAEPACRWLAVASALSLSLCSTYERD
jgi:hypothetical protein